MANRFATVNFPNQIDGDTLLTKQVNFLDDDAAPIDLSDVTPKIQIRKGSYNGKLMQTLTVGDGITWVNQALGQLQFGNVAISWDGAGDYYYDMQFTYATSGIVRTYMRGKITVIDDSTV
jgi:hypothetical protein